MIDGYCLLIYLFSNIRIRIVYIMLHKVKIDMSILYNYSKEMEYSQHKLTYGNVKYYRAYHLEIAF